MGEQTTLRIDTPLGAGETRKLTGGYYRPPITPKGISTVDRVEYGHNKATGLPGWNLHMTAKPGAGAVTVWFPRDETNLTIFCDEHNIKLPTVGKLAVNWRITWHKAGYQNVIDAIEALPEATVTDIPVADKTTLNENFPRTDDNQPAAHWIDDAKLRNGFWRDVTPWIKWSGWDGKPDDFAHDKIGKLHDWTDGRSAAATRLIKEAILERFNKAGCEMKDGTFQSAVGYPSLLAAWDKGLSDSYIRDLIDEYLATKPADPPAPDNGATTNAAPAPAISLPETKENAPVTISDGKTTPVSSGMSEAGFSMNFYWCDADGAETQFTMREATWQAGLANVEKFKAGLRALGYMPKVEYARRNGGASVPAAAPATPAPSHEGVADCVMVKVGKTFKGDKDQLVFVCAGLDDAKYSSKEAAALVKVVSGLRKLDGTAITALDLVNGSSIAVRGKVSWKRTDDGKYINVIGTIAA